MIVKDFLVRVTNALHWMEGVLLREEKTNPLNEGLSDYGNVLINLKGKTNGFFEAEEINPFAPMFQTRQRKGSQEAEDETDPL